MAQQDIDNRGVEGKGSGTDGLTGDFTGDRVIDFRRRCMQQEWRSAIVQMLSLGCCTR